MPSSSKKKSARQQQQQPHENTLGVHRSLVADMEDSFQARPTNRLGKDHKIKADGDTWQEMMAVCEAPEGSTETEGQLIIRSYYQNSRTNERVWDEPPSGATNIIPASDEVRRMANMQLEELHLVKKGKKKTEKKKTTLMGKLFGSNKKKDKKKEKRRIEYKPGSQMYANRATQDTEDAMMQEAIAASIAESKGETYVRQPPEPRSTAEDEIAMLNDEMAMAQALSMSAAEHDAEANALAHALSLSVAERENEQGQAQAPPQMHQAQTEEEILAQVMEQSKLETKRGEGDLLNMPPGNMVAPNNPFDAPLSPQDRKMRVSEVQAMTNNSNNQYPMYPQLHQDHHFPAMTPAASTQPYASTAASMPPPSAAAANPSAQYAASSNAAAAASASQYAAAMAASTSPPPAAAVSPPNMKAPPSYAMAPSNNTSPQPPTTYMSNPSAGAGARYLDPQQELLQIESELEQVRSASLSPATYQQQQQPVMRIPVNAPSVPANASLKPATPLADPFNNAPTNNASAAMFDPYSKDAAQSAPAIPPASGAATERNTSNSGLQKMEGSSTHSANKMSLFKRKSHTASTKVQDKAGLV